MRGKFPGRWELDGLGRANLGNMGKRKINQNRSNVMITLHDGKPVPKIVDFGISKATQHRLTEKRSSPNTKSSYFKNVSSHNIKFIYYGAAVLWSLGTLADIISFSKNTKMN